MQASRDTTAVIPAKAEALFNSESWSIHFALAQKAKMGFRFRGSDATGIALRALLVDRPSHQFGRCSANEYTWSAHCVAA